MSSVITFPLILVFLMAILFGAPLFTIIGGAAVVLFSLVAGEHISAIIIEMSRLPNAPGIIAIPLFIFAGYIFAESKASTRLIRVSNAFLGWIPGGMAVVTAIVCSIFTAMTGASGITIIACGGILFPALMKDRYEKNFSLGIITASGSSGVLLVPSLPIIIYGLVSQTDIAQIFIAGAIPGILIIMVLSGYGIVYGIRNKLPTTPFSIKNALESLWDIKWVIPLPFLVVGGIYGGFITVGEAGSIAVVYALISECLIYREISAEKLFSIAVISMVTVGAILVVLGTALGLTNFMVDQQIPQKLMEFMSSHISNKYVFLLILNIFLLIVGCLMDIFSAIVVTVPLIAPVAAEFGIDPVHLAIIFLANLEIGYLTPPVGINLFISSLRFGVSIIRLYRIVFIFLMLLVLALLAITYYPDLSLFLLEVLGQRAPLLTI